MITSRHSLISKPFGKRAFDGKAKHRVRDHGCEGLKFSIPPNFPGLRRPMKMAKKSYFVLGATSVYPSHS
jgi:hypothetical protein